MGLWTYQHAVTVFPALALMLAASLLMPRWLLRKPYEVRMIPIKIIAVTVVLIEIGKQCYSLSVGYDLYHIPLHFCSIFLYLLPLAAFYRGRGEEGVRSATCAAMTVLFFGMLTMPAVIYSEARLDGFFTEYLDFHTVFFHNIVIFALFLMLALDLHTPSGSRREALFVTGFGTVFVAISATMSYVLQTNYSNFLSSTVGFIATLVEEMKLAVGELPITVLYITLLAALDILLLLLANYLFMLACRCKSGAGQQHFNALHR